MTKNPSVGQWTFYALSAQLASSDYTTRTIHKGKTLAFQHGDYLAL